jgi:uncharacterized membrane protein
MKQEDINELEWRNPSNWTWRGPLGLYSSKRDTRLVAPKAMPVMGLTVNFAHPGCTYALVAIAISPFIFALVQYAFS